MKMDWGTAVVSIVSILVCVSPFVIMYYNRVKNENKMLQSLKEFAKQYNCIISEYEFCGDFVLGIDKNKNFVFFFKQKKEEAILYFANLNDIQTCQVVKKKKGRKNDVNNNVVNERIELRFLPKNKKKEETVFELYDEKINRQLTGELLFVEKWSKQINDCLRSTK